MSVCETKRMGKYMYMGRRVRVRSAVYIAAAVCFPGSRKWTALSLLNIEIL
jgi:hypothetical protein